MCCSSRVRNCVKYSDGHEFWHCPGTNEKGIYLIIMEGFRTKAYQDGLYAKGRIKPGKIVTNAKGSTKQSLAVIISVWHTEKRSR